MSPAELMLLHPDQRVNSETMRDWYGNIPREIEAGFLSDAERGYLSRYYAEAGLLRRWRRPFFFHHYAEPFARSVRYLLAGTESETAAANGVIIDLGCGTGTQSLAFALMGARVIALDADTRAIEILRKRHRFYEHHAGRTLHVEAQAADAFALDFARYAPIAGLYSMFAFNMMQPSTTLLDRLVAHGDHMRIALQDGNRMSWLGRVRKRHTLSPRELDALLTARGFRQDALDGAAALPPLLWTLLPRATLMPIERRLTAGWTFPISYLALYRKT